MKKLSNYALLMLLFGVIAFACSKDEMDAVEPMVIYDRSDATIAIGKGSYVLSDATNEGGNTWSFTIMQTGSPQGIGLSNLVIGYNFCPNESYSGVAVESAVIVNGTSSYSPVIEYSVGKGTNCAVTEEIDGFFKLDDLQSLVKDKTYTVRFTFNKALNIDEFVVWVKAGNNCAPVTIDAGTCTPPNNGCSYSQGYYFAKPYSTWSGNTVTLGGKTYNETEGRQIWNTSNAGGIASSKKVFLQAATIMLSYQKGYMNAATFNTLAADIAIIDGYLAQFNKLTTYNTLPSGGANESAALAAADRLDDFIQENHCK